MRCGDYCRKNEATLSKTPTNHQHSFNLWFEFSGEPNKSCFFVCVLCSGSSKHRDGSEKSKENPELKRKTSRPSVALACEKLGEEMGLD